MDYKWRVSTAAGIERVIFKSHCDPIQLTQSVRDLLPDGLVSPLKTSSSHPIAPIMIRQLVSIALTSFLLLAAVATPLPKVSKPMHTIKLVLIQESKI